MEEIKMAKHDETKNELLNSELVEKYDEKIKVTKAEIVVSGSVLKPYFCIHYKEVGQEMDTLGFGSYHLPFVFEWLAHYFELVEE
jgi:hypothetical protein